jgi:hypothetical protein
MSNPAAIAALAALARYQPQKVKAKQKQIHEQQLKEKEQQLGNEQRTMMNELNLICISFFEHVKLFIEHFNFLHLFVNFMSIVYMYMWTRSSKSHLNFIQCTRSNSMHNSTSKQNQQIQYVNECGTNISKQYIHKHNLTIVYPCICVVVEQQKQMELHDANRLDDNDDDAPPLIAVTDAHAHAPADTANTDGINDSATEPKKRSTRTKTTERREAKQQV